MKKLKKVKSIGIILLGISVLFLSSCSSSPENLKVIPEETNVVSVIDIYSIIKKGKLYEIGELKFFKTFKKEIRNENKKISKIIDNVIEDPTISGINFKTDIFAYYVNEANDEQFISFSAEIKNKERFAEFIEDVLDKLDIEFDIEKEKNYSYTLIGNEAVIGWDKNKAILLIAENYSSRKNLDLEITTLIELKEKNQITANDEFNRFYKNKKDISVWISTNLFEDNYVFKEIEKEIDFDITDNYISSYLNFEDDNISLLTQFTPNSEIQKIMEGNDVWDNSFNNQLLKFFPKKSYATASISLNPMSYYNIIEQKDGFEKIQSEFEKEMEFNLKDLFKSVKGNTVFSLFGFDDIEYTYMGYERIYNEKKYRRYNSWTGEYYYEGGYEYQDIEKTENELLPIMGLAIDINGNKIIKELIEKIPEDEINKRSNYYEFKFGNRYPAYFAFNDKVFIITNDKKSIKAFKDGGYSSDNLSNSNISSDISNSNFYTFLNLNYDEYPKDIKKEIKNNQNDKEEKMFKIWNSFAKSIELKQVDKNSVEIIFNIKDNESNSLNTIITTIDDNYKYFMSL